MPASPDRTRSTLATMLRTRHVPRLLTSMLVGRLPTGMAALAIVLVVRGQGADYALAGVLAGVYAAGQAAGAPLLARIVDRLRQPAVLLGSSVACATGFALFAAVDVRTMPALAAVGVLVGGAATPPLEPCLRVLWSDLLPDARTVHAAYSLDTAAQELIFTVGPLVVLAAVALGGPAAGPLAAAALCLAGTIVFASARPSRRWRGVPGERHWAGALRSAPLVRLLVGVLFVGLTIGAFTVAIAAHAEDVASRSAAAWLIAANAVGALIGGVVNATLPPAADPSRRVFWLAVLLAAGYAPLVAAPGLAGTVPLAALSGLALPPTLACVFVLVGTAAPAGAATEAFAWVVTGFGAGYAAGSALAGAVVDAAGYRPAIAITVAAAVLATVTVRRRLLPPP